MVIPYGGIDAVGDWCLRLLGPEDAGMLAEVEVEICSEAWDKTQFSDLLGQMRFVAYGVFLGPVCGGYVTAYNIDGEIEIVNIAVRPDFRRSGLGAMLMNGLQDFARHHDAGRIVLEVRAGNAPARALYARTGFCTVGVRKGYYSDPREDALILEWVTSCRA